MFQKNLTNSKKGGSLETLNQKRESAKDSRFRLEWENIYDSQKLNGRRSCGRGA